MAGLCISPERATPGYGASISRSKPVAEPAKPKGRLIPTDNNNAGR